jgi:hypothetical protein
LFNHATIPTGAIPMAVSIGEPNNCGGQVVLPVWFGIATAAIALIAALLSVPARTAFEIGKGAAKISRQKGYDWFLRKAIPSFFILGVAASAFGSFLFELLKSK